MRHASPRPLPASQQGMTLIELMLAMLLGLVVVGGVLGVFIASSETNRRTDDLARIQENARAAIQFMGRSMREAGGNPCGLPPGAGLIVTASTVSPSNWWSGGADFKDAFRGYAAANLSSFPANGTVTWVSGSDALITVSGNTFAKSVITDTPPDGAMLMTSGTGFASGDILFACSLNKGYGVIFRTASVGTIAPYWVVSRGGRFPGKTETMPITSLGKLNAEGWFVGHNARGGTSLFRAFFGDGGQPEEIAPDVSSMSIQYLLLGEEQYKDANALSAADWPLVIAAYIELTIRRKPAAPTAKAIERTVGLTVNLRNRPSNISKP